MSGIFDMLSGLSGGTAGAQASGTSIMMQAFGAAMRGEKASDFMARLANEHPQLKQIDMTNLMGSAEKLAKDKGVDLQQVRSQVDQAVNTALNK